MIRSTMLDLRRSMVVCLAAKNVDISLKDRFKNQLERQKKWSWNGRLQVYKSMVKLMSFNLWNFRDLKNLNFIGQILQTVDVKNHIN